MSKKITGFHWKLVYSDGKVREVRAETTSLFDAIAQAKKEYNLSDYIRCTGGQVIRAIYGRDSNAL